VRNRLILIAGGAALAVLVLWFLLLWGPQGSRLNDARDRRDVAQDRAEQLELQIARLRASQDRALGLAAQREQLRDAAERSGIDFISVSPSPPAASDVGEPAAVSLAISVSGGYFQVLDFINRLEALPRLVVIDTLTLTPEGADIGTVRLSAAISGRMFTTASPADAAGDAGGATATTTTTTTTPADTTTTTAPAGAPPAGEEGP